MPDELLPHEAPALSPVPVCPYCLADPAQMKALGPFNLGQLLVVVIFCGNLDCRKVWTVEVIGKEQPRVITDSGSRFAR